MYLHSYELKHELAMMQENVQQMVVAFYGAD